MYCLKSTQFTWLHKRPGLKHCLDNIMFYLYSRVKILDYKKMPEWALHG